MSGFNLSVRKDPVSMRLRAQNLKNSQDQTRRLEEDNRKMEDRLKELKTAMNREKEERERQGGGFWGKGQSNTGSLTNYASEVLHNKAEKPPKEGKKKKIKVLQDTPLDVPQRSSQPGTMKYLAQRKLTTGSTPRDKGKGPKCGQCEDRSATLNCVQCSEIYCPGCFAAFHLKGALKQHRSIPISASGPRVCMSPHPSNEAMSPRHSEGSGTIIIPRSARQNGSEASGPGQTPTLLDGSYDESQSAASFQQALMAWRQGEQPLSPRKPVVSPVKSPVVTMDESIGTVDESSVPDIKFKNTLSYAEKLMLKKHRRTELAETHTPRLGSGDEAGNPRASRSDGSLNISSRSHRHMGGRETSYSDNESDRGSALEGLINGRQESFIDDDERVDFQSLFEAVVLSESPDMKPSASFSDTSLIVSELETTPNFKSSGTYVVEEISPFESWMLEHDASKNNASSTTFILDPAENKPKSVLPKRHQEETITELFTPRVDEVEIEDVTEVSPQPTKMPKERKGKNKENQSPKEAVFQELSELPQEEKIAEVKGTKTPAARPKSSKSRPPSSRQARSRSGSRAQSRASSRMGVEGLLTKAPSDALSQVAQLAQNPDYHYKYQSPMEGFFTVGVEGQGAKVVDQERTLTPSDARPKSRAGAKSAKGEREAIKVSNKLYQMAPKSWRPDNSLGETVPLSDVKVEPEEELVLSYSYSGQISGTPTQWRPSSSQSGINMPSDDLGLNISQVFGDEMFVDIAAATPTPRPSSQQRLRGMVEGDVSTSFDKTHTPILSGRLKSAGRRRDLGSVTPTNFDPSSDGPLTPTPLSSRSEAGEVSNTPVRDRLRRKYEAKKKQEESVLESSSSHISTDGLEQEGSGSFSHRARSRQFETEPLHNQQSRNASRQSTNVESKEPSFTHQSTADMVAGVRARKSERRRAAEEEEKEARISSAPKPKRSDSNAETRPTCSNFAVSQGRSQPQSGSLRPSSSTATGGVEPLRRTLPTSYSVDDDGVQNSVVADVMMSRVQADNWIDMDLENSDQADHDSQNTGRATPLAIKSFRKGGVKPARPDSSRWETEVRPFSGRSVTSSKGDQLTSADMQSAVEVTPCADRPMSSMSGRESRAIVMEGEDLSSYDNIGDKEDQDMEDKETLHQLEWELASDTGRITANGQLSRLDIHDSQDDGVGLRSSGSSAGSFQLSSDEFDISARLCEDEKQAMAAHEELESRCSMTVDEDEVRALR